MERYESLFAQLKERKEGAFVPFVTLGDPGFRASFSTHGPGRGRIPAPG